MIALYLFAFVLCCAVFSLCMCFFMDNSMYKGLLCASFYFVCGFLQVFVLSCVSLYFIFVCVGFCILFACAYVCVLCVYVSLCVRLRFCVCVCVCVRVI